MIKAVIYDKVANTTAGIMQGEMRVWPIMFITEKPTHSLIQLLLYFIVDSAVRIAAADRFLPAMTIIP